MMTLDLIDQEYTQTDVSPRTNYLGSITSNHSSIPPSIESCLSQLGPLPSNTLFMGICDDGLPLLFDLKDPSPHSMLLIGNHKSGKTLLLKSLLFSLNVIDVQNSVQYSVITPNTGEYQEQFSYPNCIDVFSSYDRSAAEHIIQISTLAEQRRSGRQLGQSHILIIEDLQELLAINDFDTLNHLRWLVTKGALSSCWTFATLNSDNYNKTTVDVSSLFRTQIYCHNTGAYSYGRSGQLANRQSSGYSIQTGTSSTYFWLPE